MGIFKQIQSMGHEEVVFCHDTESGLKAIIAIHDTTLGPALGGCRLWDYASEDEAINDVLRLSRGMTYKAACAGLSLGGGKSVIIGDAKAIKSEQLFRAFGRFVDSLGGRYITAEDVNIKTADMAIVAKETKYATGLENTSGDPSPITALGVFHGIKASVKHKLGLDSLSGIKVAIQGAGGVGGYLASYLKEEGATVYVSDIDAERVKYMVDNYGAIATAIDDIHSQDVDVYAPCALGAIINDTTIPQIKATIIAGGANNQLLDEDKHGEMLKEKGVLIAPDYVINAGGLINVYHELKGYDVDAAKAGCAKIYDTLLDIFRTADDQGITTIAASNAIAQKIIDQHKGEAKLLSRTRDNTTFS